MKKTQVNFKNLEKKSRHRLTRRIKFIKEVLFNNLKPSLDTVTSSESINIENSTGKLQGCNTNTNSIYGKYTRIN